MVLINDKKYACATCIKGHRVSGCTHTDRPLFEVKKKGRPVTQCAHCREKRKSAAASGAGNGAVHTKCICGDVKPANVILPSTRAGDAPHPPSRPDISKSSSPTDDESAGLDFETRKGVPGSNPTYPNGLRDVHEMAAAADALTDFGDNGMKMLERSVASLLNPCHCKTTGICKCCQPRRPRDANGIRPSPPPPQLRMSSGSRTPAEPRPSRIDGGSMEATSCCSAPNATQSGSSFSNATEITRPISVQHIAPANTLLSPDNMHHPAHTSRHVHKAKLYSPYSTGGHAAPRLYPKRDSSSNGRSANTVGPSSNRPISSIRPIVDMNTFLGAVIRDDGTIAEEIPRSALGLPGIKAFDQVAEIGGVKIESMEMDLDPPVHFPTSEDVVVGGCTCKENCDCPGCLTHGVPPRSEQDPHRHDGTCGNNCSSHFDCTDHIAIPSGIGSIEQLLAVAAAHVPAPARPRPMDINALDTRIAPPSVHVNEDAARSLGYVQLKPLECCNGRCQCPPGQCTCEKECCGCCVKCMCAEDGDARMEVDAGGRDAAQAVKSACCSGAHASPKTNCAPEPAKRAHAPASIVASATPPLAPLSTADQGLNVIWANPLVPQSTTPLLAPSGAASIPQASSNPAAASQAPQSLQRAASISKASLKHAGAGGLGRRATVTSQTHGAGSSIQRSASTGKSASKALALHTQPYHPRPILPKPSNHPAHHGLPKGSQGVARLEAASRSGQPSSSGQPSRSESPAPPFDQPSDHVTGMAQNNTQIVVPSLPSFLTQSSGMAGIPPGPDPMSANFPPDPDFLAYLNQIAAADPSLLQNLMQADPTLPQSAFPSGNDEHLDFDFDHLLDGSSSHTPLDPADGMSFDEILAQMTAEQAAQGIYQAPIVDFPNAGPALQSSSLTYDAHGVSDGGSLASQAQQPSQVPPQFALSSDEVAQLYQAFLQTASQGEVHGQMPDYRGGSLPNSYQPVEGYHNSAAPSSANGPSASHEGAHSTRFDRSLPDQGPSSSSGLPHERSPPPAPPPRAEAKNPDLIDLSKPLNAQDMERILRALQKQQQQQETPQQQQQPKRQQQSSSRQDGTIPTVPVQGPSRVPPYENGDALARASRPYAHSTHLSGLDVGSAPPLPPMPAYSDASSNLNSADASLTFGDGALDPFEKFTFGDGLDLSVLDLGDVGGGGVGAGLGMGGAGLEERTGSEQLVENGDMGENEWGLNMEWQRMRP